MTVTKDTPHLRLFKLKIDEAVNYVPKMAASEKLRAVHFWNVVSEKLQDIINSCAADINAISVKTQENETQKILLEMSQSRSLDPNTPISSDFINLSSSYGMNSGIGEQYHIGESSSGQLLAAETPFSIVKEESVIHNPFIHRLNDASEKNDSYVPLPGCSCDTLGVDSCDSRTCESNLTQDYSSNERQVHSLPTSILCPSDNLSVEYRNAKPKNSSKNYPILRNLDPDCDEDSTDSLKSDSNPIEPIVSFVVSNSEEILAKNGLTPKLGESGDKQHKSYKCCDCSARFANRGNLIVHMRRHTGEKPYSCGKCSSRFTTRGNLKRHMKTHTGEKPYQCTSCGGKFTEKKSLIVHMRRHTGEKPYECKECGKRFTQQSILQTHMSMHLDQKCHLCEHCGKSFRQRSQLQTHKLRHMNVRKYACSSCSSRFLTKGDLERHRRTHTGERPYVCKVCSKSYTRQQSLNEHLNRHYGIRPYTCKYCSRAFSQMSACYKHIKQHEKADAKLLLSESSSELPRVESEAARSEAPHPSLTSFMENFFPH